MTPLRLAIVTPRFWPLVGGVEKVLGHLGVGLLERGFRVTILTLRWQPAWPERIALRGLPVVRLPRPRRAIGPFPGYVQPWGRWLRQHQDDFDLVYVSGLGHAARAAITTLGDRLPVVVRAERAGPHGDCQWQSTTREGRRCRKCCQAAAAVVAPTVGIRHELEATGYPPSLIHEISNGVPLLAPRTAESRTAARALLREAAPWLDVPRQGPLALYAGPLRAGRGLDRLVAAWEPIAARWPTARLWLAGDGPERAALLEQIEAMNLKGRVVHVGVFDTIDELLAAADLFVSPTMEDGSVLALQEAMGAGLPIVAGDAPAHRDPLADGREALLVSTAAPQSLTAAIARLIERPTLATRLAAAARERAAVEYPLAKMVDAHVALFERLTAVGRKQYGP